MISQKFKVLSMIKNNNALPFLDSAFETLMLLRQKSPIIHNITNQVASQRTADILLALGCSPLMADEDVEMREITNISQALSINIGTLHTRQLKSMLRAVENMKHHKKPWVLDPVGVGASLFRRQACRDLIIFKPNIIRGNASEILALAGETAQNAAIDSQNKVEEAHDAARSLALEHKNIVVVSGAKDYITNGTDFSQNQNGHPLMTKITATGCALSSVLAGFLTELPAFEAAKVAFLIYNISGEIAAKLARGPGSFQNLFLDTLFNLSKEQIYKTYLLPS
ncbi:hydroxyethylthiazole kinase [Acetobacteraceae bacterium]|nr:hydroxyethylthiazole kinase [Acetobacteraceae bacterium]